MSAIFNNSSSKALTAAVSIPASSSLLIACWAKWDNTTLGSSNHIMAVGQASGDASPGTNMYFTNTGTLALSLDANSGTGSSNAISADTWTHCAVGYVGRNGTSTARRIWLGGTLTSPTGSSIADPSITLAYLVLGRSIVATSAWKGRIAQAGVWVGKTTTEWATIVADLQSYNVDTISIAPDYSWRISSAVTAATGGVDLTNVGTVTFDGADDPTLTDYSAGGSTLIVGTFL
jgi:hypothetical protein